MSAACPLRHPIVACLCGMFALRRSHTFFGPAGLAAVLRLPWKTLVWGSDCGGCAISIPYLRWSVCEDEGVTFGMRGFALSWSRQTASGAWSTRADASCGDLRVDRSLGQQAGQQPAGVHRHLITSVQREQLTFLKLLHDRYPYLTLSIGEDTAALLLYSWLPVCPHRSSRPFNHFHHLVIRCIQLTYRPPPPFDTRRTTILGPISSSTYSSHLIRSLNSLDIQNPRGIPTRWPPMEPPRRTPWQCSKRSFHRSGHSSRSTPSCPPQ
jgi:hypothetical protein